MRCALLLLAAAVVVALPSAPLAAQSAVVSTPAAPAAAASARQAVLAHIAELMGMALFDAGATDRENRAP